MGVSSRISKIFHNFIRLGEFGLGTGGGFWCRGGASMGPEGTPERSFRGPKRRKIGNWGSETGSWWEMGRARLSHSGGKSRQAGLRLPHGIRETGICPNS